MFLQSNSHSAGGWSRAISDMSVSFWKTSSNVGFPHWEMYVLSQAANFFQEILIHSDDTDDSGHL